MESKRKRSIVWPTSTIEYCYREGELHDAREPNVVNMMKDLDQQPATRDDETDPTQPPSPQLSYAATLRFSLHEDPDLENVREELMGELAKTVRPLRRMIRFAEHSKCKSQSQPTLHASNTRGIRRAHYFSTSWVGYPEKKKFSSGST